MKVNRIFKGSKVVCTNTNNLLAIEDNLIIGQIYTVEKTFEIGGQVFLYLKNKYCAHRILNFSPLKNTKSHLPKWF
jgi:hypothetical protein